MTPIIFLHFLERFPPFTTFPVTSCAKIFLVTLPMSLTLGLSVALMSVTSEDARGLIMLRRKRVIYNVYYISGSTVT